MNENYTDEDLQKAKRIIALDMERNNINVSSQSTRTQCQLPADTEHGMCDSDDEEYEPTGQMPFKKYLEMDFR